MALVTLVVPEEFNSHPGPKVEEHVHWDSNGQEQAVEAEAARAGAALREVFLHRGRVEKSCQRNQRDEDGERRKRKEHCLLPLTTCHQVSKGMCCSRACGRCGLYECSSTAALFLLASYFDVSSLLPVESC